MQFPYACESYKRNFSDTMLFCFNSTTEYMSIKDEHLYSERVLKVVITAV